MLSEQIEYLKRQHDFNAWQGLNALKEDLFIWHYFLRGSEFQGWQMQSQQQLALTEELRCIQSAWRGQAENTDASIRATIYECPSRLEAHRFLLQLLGQFHLPGVERQKDIEVGDVAFTGRDKTCLLFARANCLFVLHNADRKLVPVHDIARPLDRALYDLPRVSPPSKSAPQIRRFATSVADAGVGESVPLEIETSERPVHPAAMPSQGPATEAAPEKDRLTYKFFSSAGEVLLEQGRPVYKPKSKGRQKITAFVLDAAQGVGSQVCRLNVR